MPTMLEELKQVNTAVIEELSAAQQERDVLAERLARLDEEKAEISGPVYRTVHDDYLSHRRELEKRVAALSEKARAEYAPLAAILERVKSDLESAHLEREELEVRHRLGEFKEEELQARLKGTLDRLGEHEQHLAEIEEVKEKFLAVFGSEEDLAGPPPDSKGQSEELSRPTPENVATPMATTPVVGKPGSHQEKEETAAEKTEEEVDLDGSAPSSGSDSQERTSAADGDAPASAGPPADEAGKTVYVTPALLVEKESGNEYPLGVYMDIGREGENHIQLEAVGVSRRHASVTFTPGGFVIKDEQSSNGTFVNDERVTERVLVNGDIVRIGVAQMQFRTM